MFTGTKNIGRIGLALMMATGLCSDGYAQPDIDIAIDKTGSDSLVVKVRNNGATFSELMSSLVFTIRWPNTSSAGLGSSAQPCLEAFAISGTSTVNTGGYYYKTYNAIGFATLSESCPASDWTSGQFVTLAKIKVTNVTGCTDFAIVEDAYTNSNNRDYFVSLNGLNRTGYVLTSAVGIGSCANDCLGQPGGTARPGTLCDDNNGATAHSIWSGTCSCIEAECVEVVLSTDASPGETTWELSGASTFNGGPYSSLPNVAVIKRLLAPMGSCFSMVVNDSGGNGICCSEGQGGYVLRTCDGRVILDNTDDGGFGSSSSSSCTNDFCLPLGAYAITGATNNAIETDLWRVPGYCSLTSSVALEAPYSPTVTANYNHSSSTTYGFRYQLFDPDGLTTGHSGHDVCVCSGACTLSQLSGAFCRSVFYDVNGPYTTNATGPTDRRYAFYNASGLLTNRPPMDVWLNIRVQEVIDGVSGNYGPVVRVMYVDPGRAPEAQGAEGGVVVEVPELSVWPNPTGQGQVFIALRDPVRSGVAMVTLFDAQGRQVLVQQYTMNMDGRPWEFDAHALAAGLYTMNVSVAGEVFSERLVVE